jgi:beta-lactamase regulating signal transducer with metallopeptidase domain
MHALLEIGLTNALMATGLALVAVVVSCFHRRPALTYSLWLLVLIKLVTPPLVHIPIPWEPSPAETEAAAAPTSASEMEVCLLTEPFEFVDEQALPELSAAIPATMEEPAPPRAASTTLEAAPWQADWPALLAWAWLGSALVWLGMAVQRMFRFNALLAYAQPAPAHVQRQARRLAVRLGLADCPGVWLVPGRISPMLWALGGAPRLILPAGFWERLPQRQQETLLVHELAHVRRRDHWVRVFELLVTSLYWWHPVLWWARRELRQAEEECCDAWVVSVLPESARAYAIALVETVDFLSEAGAALPLGASGIGEVQDLKRRLTMIMRGSTPRALTWGGLLAVAALGLVLLPVRPTWAQAPAKVDFVVQKADKDARDADAEQKVAELKAHLEAAQAQFKQAQANLERAQRQLKEAAERLATAGGAKARLAGAGGGQVSITIRTPDGKTQTFTVPDGKLPEDVANKIFSIQRKVESKVENKLEGQHKTEEPKGKGSTLSAPRVTPDGRSQDLEKRLDRLMQEIESLRKELRSRNPGEVHLYEYKSGDPHVFTFGKPGDVHSYQLKVDDVRPHIILDGKTIPGHLELQFKKAEPTPKPE